jgi:hypothetical protein
LINRLVVAVLLVFASISLRADEQRVLVPVSLGQSEGAHHSLWRGQLWAHNRGTTTAFIQTHWSLCRITCPPGQFVIPPGASTSIPIHSPSLLYITPTPYVGTTHVSFNARVWDESRQSTDWGVELPLVHENDFSSEGIHLLNVPVTAEFRLTLRIYEPEGRTSTQALVRAYDLTSNALLGERTVNLVSDLEFGWSAYDVGYYENDLLQLFPELSAHQRTRLEITSEDPAKKLWAFVSITHNETQRVTLVTPQP